MRPAPYSLRTRNAAVLVCVMVVLLIVGLLSAQTIQSLLVVRRSDHQRSRLRQSREVLELGQLMIAGQQIPESGQVSLDVDGQPAILRIEELRTERPASQQSLREQPKRYRLTAEYPADMDGAISVTWESPK